MRIVAAGADQLDRVEPLWLALLEHHAACAPRARELRPFRAGPDSWRVRRARYERWLAEPGARLLLAECGDGRAVGYAVVRVRAGEAMLATGDQVGEIETLSILPDERGRGIGERLMEQAYAHLRSLGVREVGLAVIDGNEGALRFYERLGMRPYVTHLVGPVPD